MPKGYKKTREEKRSCCGRFANLMNGLSSGRDYFNVLYCHDTLCPICGKKGGQNHKKRKRKILDQIISEYGSLDGLASRRFVFTVPSEVRELLQDREALNVLLHDVHELLKKEFPGRQVYSALHPVGDKSSDFHPHVDVCVIERLNVQGGVRMRLGHDRLDIIKNGFVASLQRRGYEIDDAVVWYGFNLKKAQFLHSLKYVSRPCPDYEQRKIIETENPALFQFLESDEMRGFKFVRKLRVKVDQSQYIEGKKTVKLEKMRFVERVPFNWSKFTDQYRLHERCEVFPGFWTVRNGGFTDDDKIELQLNSEGKKK